MRFLRVAANPWTPEDLLNSATAPRAPAAAVLHVLKTTALIESRADDYADYLRAVFADCGLDCIRAIDGWNLEERRHGELLCALAARIDPHFDPAAAMEAYRDSVDYHPCDGQSVRGSIAAELISRCVVEALASTYYRVLHDACDDPMLRAALATLARDEARHYGMFRAMLLAHSRLPRWRRLLIGLRRMLELSDAQISAASAVVAGRSADGPMQRTLEAQRYAAALYPCFRWRHLRFAGRLLADCLLQSQSDRLQWLLAAALWVGVQVKRVVAVVVVQIADAPSPASRRGGRACGPRNSRSYVEQNIKSQRDPFSPG